MCCCCESPQRSEASGDVPSDRRTTVSAASATPAVSAASAAIERHISITRAGADGVVRHTEVHITTTTTAAAAAAAGEYFDPASCCDVHERAMIAALRSYLRPEVAPACLMARLKATLDHCCEEEGE